LIGAGVDIWDRSPPVSAAGTQSDAEGRGGGTAPSPLPASSCPSLISARHSPAQRGVEGMPARLAEGFLALMKVRALPIAGFWPTTSVPRSTAKSREVSPSSQPSPNAAPQGALPGRGGGGLERWVPAGRDGCGAAVGDADTAGSGRRAPWPRSRRGAGWVVGCGVPGRATLMLTGDVKLFASQSRG